MHQTKMEGGTEQHLPKTTMNELHIQRMNCKILREKFLPQPGFEPQISWILVRHSPLELLTREQEICGSSPG